MQNVNKQLGNGSIIHRLHILVINKVQTYSTVLRSRLRCIGVAPKKKVVRPNFFSEGVFPRIIFRYMHKDQFLCIFSQIKNNAYLPVHLVHAPSFWWSPSFLV